MKDICICGHSRLHHYFTVKRSGINSHKTNPKSYNKMCDVKACFCSGYKEKKDD
jgi:hypothetical protein